MHRHLAGGKVWWRGQRGAARAVHLACLVLGPGLSRGLPYGRTTPAVHMHTPLRPSLLCSILKKHGLNAAYANYQPDALSTFEEAYWAGNAPRLAAIKTKYDPLGLFSKPGTMQCMAAVGADAAPTPAPAPMPTPASAAGVRCALASAVTLVVAAAAALLL